MKGGKMEGLTSNRPSRDGGASSMAVCMTPTVRNRACKPVSDCAVAHNTMPCRFVFC